MERLLWSGPDGLCVWSADDGAYLYRVTRYGTTVRRCRSMRDVFGYLRSHHAVA